LINLTKTVTNEVPTYTVNFEFSRVFPGTTEKQDKKAYYDFALDYNGIRPNCAKRGLEKGEKATKEEKDQLQRLKEFLTEEKWQYPINHDSENLKQPKNITVEQLFLDFGSFEVN
jgi:hypothetical protein